MWTVIPAGGVGVHVNMRTGVRAGEHTREWARGRTDGSSRMDNKNVREQECGVDERWEYQRIGG